MSEKFKIITESYNFGIVVKQIKVWEVSWEKRKPTRKIR
jgi:hypothetical protein